MATGWNTQIPKDIDESVGAFVSIVRRVNRCLQAIRALSNMKGTGGTTVKVSDGNIVISSKVMPSGYGPEEFTICDSGSPATRNFITDNPD